MLIADLFCNDQNPENNPDIHQQMNGWKTCSLSIYWNKLERTIDMCNIMVTYAECKIMLNIRNQMKITLPSNLIKILKHPNLSIVSDINQIISTWAWVRGEARQQDGS